MSMPGENASMADDSQGLAQQKSEWDPAKAEAIATSLAKIPGACLPILHALQGEFGYIHKDAIPIVADVLNLSRAEIVGVVNFYHDFRQEPPGRHIVRVCRGEACQSMGSQALVEHLTTSLSAAVGETTADGAVSLAAAYCLGNCALSPALMIDGKLHGRVTPKRATELLVSSK
jgi:formate dehydrogenase subunit gamma